MIATIHQPQYLPWLGYFDKADRADIFILLDNVQFKKNDWQNRNRIRTSQGWQWLTVPIFHDFGQKITEVRINNNDNWREAHLKAIILNYGRAPFFDDYIGIFEDAYARPWTYLVDINIYFIEKFIDLLGIRTQLVRASAYDAADDSTQRLIDLCQAVGTDTYIAGVDGAKYMDFDKFKEHDIAVVTQDFVHPFYPQVWIKDPAKDFISHLSVIDLLFNCGGESLSVLRSGVKKE